MFGIFSRINTAKINADIEKIKGIFFQSESLRQAVGGKALEAVQRYYESRGFKSWEQVRLYVNQRSVKVSTYSVGINKRFFGQVIDSPTLMAIPPKGQPGLRLPHGVDFRSMGLVAVFFKGKDFGALVTAASLQTGPGKLHHRPTVVAWLTHHMEAAPKPDTAPGDELVIAAAQGPIEEALENINKASI